MIDFEKALSGMNGDRSLLNESLQDFIDFYADAGERIETALSRQRYQDAEMVAHTLKGLGATFAAEELKSSAAAVEKALQCKELDQLDGQLADLKAAIDQMLAALRQFLKP